MKKHYAHVAFATAVALTVFAGTGSATPVTFAFTVSPTAAGTWGIDNGGAGFTAGHDYALSSLSSILFSTLTVGNDGAHNGGYTLTDGGTVGGNCTNAAGATMQKSGSGSNISLTLYGAVTGLTGIDTGCNALVTLTGAFTGTFILGSPDSGQFSFAGLSGITETGQLLSDLGLSGPYSSGLASGAGIGTSGGTIAGTVDTFNASSEQFTLNLTAAPEPFSFALMGTGLAALIFKARKKTSRPA